MYKRGSFHLLAEAYKQVIAPNRINAHNYDILKDNLAELAKVARVLPNKREAGYDDELEEKVDSLARVLGLIKRDNEEDYQKILRRRKSIDDSGQSRYNDALPEVVIVSSILEVIKHVLVDNDLDFTQN